MYYEFFSWMTLSLRDRNMFKDASWCTRDQYLCLEMALVAALYTTIAIKKSYIKKSEVQYSLLSNTYLNGGENGDWDKTYVKWSCIFVQVSIDIYI